MNKRIFSLALTALVAMPLAALADCTDPQTQSEMNMCANQDLAKADAELNATYKALMRTLDKTQQAEVKAIQLLWIQFKNRTCHFESTSAEGGSIQPLLLSSCLTQLTKARTKDLKTWAQMFGPN